MIPFWPDVINGFYTLNTYLQHWEFSGFIFRSLRNITDSADTSRIIIGVSFSCIVGLIYLHLFLKLKLDDIEKIPQKRLISSFYMVSIAYLLLTPTLHPWYALYLVAFLPFAAEPSGIVLSWAVMMSYRVLIFYKTGGRWIEDDLTAALIWLAPVATFIAVSSIPYLFRRFTPEGK